MLLVGCWEYHYLFLGRKLCENFSTIYTLRWVCIRRNVILASRMFYLITGLKLRSNNLSISSNTTNLRFFTDIFFWLSRNSRRPEINYVFIRNMIDTFSNRLVLLPGVPTTIWHLSNFFQSSSTGNPPMNTWHLSFFINLPIDRITSWVCTAISLVGAIIST